MRQSSRGYQLANPSQLVTFLGLFPDKTLLSWRAICEPDDQDLAAPLCIGYTSLLFALLIFNPHFGGGSAAILER